MAYGLAGSTWMVEELPSVDAAYVAAFQTGVIRAIAFLASVYALSLQHAQRHLVSDLNVRQQSDLGRLTHALGKNISGCLNSWKKLKLVKMIAGFWSCPLAEYTTNANTAASAGTEKAIA